MGDKIKVAVMLGGRSGEHEVSLSSAQSVMGALDQERFEIIPVGITREGAWIVGTETTSGAEAIRAVVAALKQENFSETVPVAILPDPTRQGVWRIDPDSKIMSLLSAVDVVFPVLHGTFGEDGTLQGLLEMANLPCVGPGVLASAAAMDKILFKDVCKANGLPTPEYLGFNRSRWRREPEAVVAEIEAYLSYPLFVKPANLGSSVGITKCHKAEELHPALETAARYDRRILVEVAVPAAREIEVSVLGNEDPRASLPGEIIPSREFYDYAAKYLDDGEQASKLLIPAPISEELTEKVRAIAVKAFKAIDGAGMSRVDFLLSAETEALYLNEINTIPGFTSISMYPKLWAATGVPYPQLLAELIDLAIERHNDNAQSERVYRPTL